MKVFTISSFGILLFTLVASCNHSATTNSAGTTAGTNSVPQSTGATSTVTTIPPNSTPPTSIPPTTIPPTITPTPPTDQPIAFPILINAKSAIAIAHHPAMGLNSFYIAERHGYIWQLTFDSVGRIIDETIVLDITDDTLVLSELGLLSMTISPEGDWLYISYSNTKADKQGSSTPPNVVDAVRRSELDGQNPESVARTRIITIPQPASNHNGGDISFSPTDGYLYISLGDGGGANDTFNNGQNLQTLHGSILRIDPNPKAGGYDIPDDNPFVGRDDLAGGSRGVREEIWAYGIRNAWRMSFDQNGDLWIGDVGQNKIEEINRIPNAMGGLNLGWSKYEGSNLFGSNRDELSDHHLPVFQYPHTTRAPAGENETRCSITGGFIYRGERIPELQGKYIYADYCLNGMIRAFDPASGTDILVAHQPSVGAIINFGRDPFGEIIVASQLGTFYLLPTSAG